MAGVFDPSQLTFNGEEVKDIREAVWEKVFQRPEFQLFHSVHAGIKTKQQIAYVGKLGLIGRKADPESCEPEESSETITLAEKFWDPMFVEDRLKQCWKDLNNSLFRYSMKNGVQVGDLEGTDYAIVLEDRVSEAVQEMVWRLVWFGDTAADNAPTGVITSGVDLEYWNPIDGFWKQMIAIATADTTKYVSDLSTINGQTSYANQVFDVANNDTQDKLVTGTLEKLKYNADYRLRQRDDLVFITTQSVADQYAKELRSQSLDSSFERIEGGYKALMFEDIPVVGVALFDDLIRNYQDDGSAYYLPHRAVLTTKENLAVGLEEAGDFAGMATDWFYDRRDKSFYTDIGMHIDAKVIEDYMIQIAY